MAVLDRCGPSVPFALTYYISLRHTTLLGLAKGFRISRAERSWNAVACTSRQSLVNHIEVDVESVTFAMSANETCHLIHHPVSLSHLVLITGCR
jgi:hypothetical protein